MAAREFTEIWGEQMHAARHLRMLTGTLAVVLVLLGVALVRVAWPHHRSRSSSGWMRSAGRRR